MNYRIMIYLLMGMFSAYALSGINFNILFKKNRIIEARFLYAILSMALGYLSGSFLIQFFEVNPLF